MAALAWAAPALAQVPAASQQPAPIAPQVLEGAMLAIDGETLMMADGTIIRLFGIDAPEAETQEGWRAKMALDSRTTGRRLSCEVLDHDRDGRPVAACAAPPGSADLARDMLRDGWATTYRVFLRGNDREASYLAAEREASAAGRGLWGPPGDPEKRDGIGYLGPLATIVAAFVGFFGATVMNDRFARRRAERQEVYERKALASAIGGELLIIKDLSSKVHLEAVDDAGTHIAMKDRWPPNVLESVTTIYRANASKLGALGLGMAAEIVTFYGFATMMMRAATMHGWNAEVIEFAKTMRRLYKSLAPRIDEIAATGEIPQAEPPESQQTT